ncbi:carboxypeptidase-like regulatory domain-containing protein [Cellulophaga lytica]|uniref:carboxypeptidase-like regulatory domain-containing protein n=1 Tax=Cellulophaga lytica TaxID=979 RepID=UPI000951413C|nr:carboxypeptidase-like regulatory domain-containing protein [Cellulophaga lytica]
MKYICTLLLLLVAAQNTSAQTKIETLKGRIVSNTQDVVGVYVLNKTTNKGTITSKTGNFSIPVSLKDTIMFSAVQFKNKKIVVTQKILDYKSFLVNLDETLEELNEVVLDNRTLITAKSLGLPNADVEVLPLAKRELFAANNGDNYLSLDPLLNFLSGRTKMLKDRIKRDDMYARSKELRTRFVDSVFSKNLKIPASRIEEFMLYCEYDPRFKGITENKNELVVWDFLRQKSELFLKFK